MPPKPKVYLANAGTIKRLLAFMLDLLLLNLIVLTPFRGLLNSSLPEGDFESMYNLMLQNDGVYSTVYASAVAIALIILSYFVFTEWKLGQTLGKMMFGLFVVAETNGRQEKLDIKERVKFWQALVRSAYFVPIFPLFFLIIIDPIYMLFNKNGQRLSERLSRTRVVEMYRWM